MEIFLILLVMVTVMVNAILGYGVCYRVCYARCYHFAMPPPAIASPWPASRRRTASRR